MNKIILTLILGIFLISFISSAPISISPSSIIISAYPGETILQNLTIYSEGNYSVYFNSSNGNVTIEPTIFLVESELNVTINITFAKDIIPGIIKFNIFVETSYPEKKVVVEVPVEVSRGGGGSYTQKQKIEEQNRTITILNKTLDELNESLNECENGLCPLDNSNEVIDMNYYIHKNVIFWAIAVTIFCIAVILINEYYRRKK